MASRLSDEEVEAILNLAGVVYRHWGFGTAYWVDYVAMDGPYPVVRSFMIPTRNGKSYPGDVEDAIRLATTPPNYQIRE